MAKTMLKISVVYFMIGISFGLYMSLTHVFDLSTVHVHINLLGWMSLALVGLFYHHYPNLERTGLAKAHFWLHNIGLPVMMIAIALAILGVNDVFFPIATLGGLCTLIGIFCFGFNVLKNLDQRTA
ncbi:cytochrome-c oxidase [Sporosarcina sp. HYO08]|uniref:cytochrome-c oxidase n=1 Tax=Sporosarcina sp. HYO08 TaxID=1759557 RepID=UPI00079281F5|nr:cytochrome-c oxidase [Sporosarcina sp. HYO08]KXH86721.1 cytochrome-c oxidase [Sporosarcina sp. HYO08]